MEFFPAIFHVFQSLWEPWLKILASQIYLKWNIVVLLLLLMVSWQTEPRQEKTCLRGLQPGKIQTGLLSYRD